MPIISVIIPVYNAEKTIEKTINSVLSQSFENFEIIVINDGSTDRTLAILDKFSDSRIKVFSYKNSGAQKSRNRGIEKASGEYLAFLDSDDLWTPDKLKLQLSALKKHPEAAVAYSWTNWVDENGSFLRRGSYLTENGYIFRKLLLVDFIENGSNPLIRADAIAKVGEFDESLVGGQDWDMWLRLAALYQFIAVPYPQILYRQSPTSWSANVERQERGFRQVIEKTLTHESERGGDIKNHIIANRYKCLIVDVFQGLPNKKQSLIAAKFLKTAIIHDPTLLRSKVLFKIIARIIVIMFLSSSKAEKLLNKYPKLFDIKTIMGYLKVKV